MATTATGLRDVMLCTRPYAPEDDSLPPLAATERARRLRAEVLALITEAATDYVRGAIDADGVWPSWDDVSDWLTDPETWDREILGGLPGGPVGDLTDAERRYLRRAEARGACVDVWTDEILRRYGSWRAWVAYVARADQAQAEDLLRRYGPVREPSSSRGMAWTVWDALARLDLTPRGDEIPERSWRWREDVCCPMRPLTAAGREAD